MPHSAIKRNLRARRDRPRAVPESDCIGLPFNDSPFSELNRCRRLQSIRPSTASAGKCVPALAQAVAFDAEACDALVLLRDDLGGGIGDEVGVGQLRACLVEFGAEALDLLVEARDLDRKSVV